MNLDNMLHPMIKIRELIFLVLLFLPIACKATIKKDTSGSCTFEDKKIRFDTIPKKPDFFRIKHINSDFPKYEYLNETGFLPRTNTSSSSEEDDKSYEHYRRMKDEDVKVVDTDTKDTITLGKERAYNFRIFKPKWYLNEYCHTIQDYFYQDGTQPVYKVSKEDWDKAINQSDEYTFNGGAYKEYVRIRFKDGKTIEYDVKNNNHSHDWTDFKKHKGYEYYYEHCTFDNYKENSAYDVLEDGTIYWIYFKDTRRDFKEIVQIIKDAGHYAEYQDSVDSGHCGWSANIQLKHDEIDFIELR